MDQFWSLLAGSTVLQPNAGTLVDRAGNARQAILMILRAAGSDAAKNVWSGQQLLRRLNDAQFDIAPLLLLVRHLTLSNDLASSIENRKTIPGVIFPILTPLLPDGMTAEKFAALSVFDEHDAAILLDANRAICTVEHNGRQLDIHIGSLASMKGETHLATLVLESLGHPSRRFDLQEALPVISGLTPRNLKLKESALSQYRNLYVGMSRPTGFLCLAVNSDRVSDECKAALVDRGWNLKYMG